MPDQKPMWTRCLGWFSVMWVTKLMISPVKKGLFAQKRPNLAQNWHFWSIWARVCIWWPVGGSVGGCGARAVSRKTPIYFITNISWCSLLLSLILYIVNSKDLKHDLPTFLQLLHSLLLAMAQLSAPLWKWKHIENYVGKSFCLPITKTAICMLLCSGCVPKLWNKCFTQVFNSYSFLPPEHFSWREASTCE